MLSIRFFVLPVIAAIVIAALPRPAATPKLTAACDPTQVVVNGARGNPEQKIAHLQSKDCAGDHNQLALVPNSSAAR